MQEDARRNSSKIVEDNQRLQQELKTRREQAIRRHKQLEELARKSNIDRAKVEAEKEKVFFFMFPPMLFYLLFLLLYLNELNLNLRMLFKLLQNANENVLLDLATLKHKKAREELRQLLKKHEVLL